MKASSTAQAPASGHREPGELVVRSVEDAKRDHLEYAHGQLRKVVFGDVDSRDGRPKDESGATSLEMNTNVK